MIQQAENIKQYLESKEEYQRYLRQEEEEEEGLDPAWKYSVLQRLAMIVNEKQMTNDQIRDYLQHLRSQIDTTTLNGEETKTTTTTGAVHTP